MNILIIGSGGREHALAWKMSQSPKCHKLFVIPGNAGTHMIAQNIDIAVTDFPAIANFVLDQNISLVVVGPEAPLVAGIRDYFDSQPPLRNIMMIGPGKDGALLEGSKDFAKKFMNRHGIPTAASKTFSSSNTGEAIRYIKSLHLPIVLKADGLAAGKGVIICQDYEEAESIIIKMLDEKMFGDASTHVVIENFLEGIELSVFVLTDGDHYVILPEAKDYKRIGNDDTGPNTGGMGAVSPVKFADKNFMKKVEERIVIPTVEGLRKENIDYRGFLFIGLMNQGGDPFVIEYNVRMGDPESQVVFPRLNTDLVDLFEATARKNLNGIQLSVSEDTAVTVVLASSGYPGNYEKGKIISGANKINEGIIFHAGTKIGEDGLIVTDGGRVMAVTGKGGSIQDARQQSYKTINSVSWEGMLFRDDIGLDLLKMK